MYLSQTLAVRELSTNNGAQTAGEVRKSFVAFLVLLADRTNGRATATLLRLSSVVCNVMYCGQTVRPRAKVTMESL